MTRRIDHAAQFTKRVDEHRKRCSERDCVNWKCDGTRHRNLAGKKWGNGWPKGGRR
jgi:hypothetical protein